MVVYHDIRTESMHNINAISRCTVVSVPAPIFWQMDSTENRANLASLHDDVGFEVQERPLPADTAAGPSGDGNHSPTKKRKV